MSYWILGQHTTPPKMHYVGLAKGDYMSCPLSAGRIDAMLRQYGHKLIDWQSELARGSCVELPNGTIISMAGGIALAAELSDRRRKHAEGLIDWAEGRK